MMLITCEGLLSGPQRIAKFIANYIQTDPLCILGEEWWGFSVTMSGGESRLTGMKRDGSNGRRGWRGRETMMVRCGDRERRR